MKGSRVVWARYIGTYLNYLPDPILFNTVKTALTSGTFSNKLSMSSWTSSGIKFYLRLKNNKATIFTVRNEVAKVTFLHLSVTLFTGGVCLSACWDITPPKEAPPPRGSTPPLGGSTSSPGAETATAVEGMHPTGMHSCCEYRNSNGEL